MRNAASAQASQAINEFDLQAFTLEPLDTQIVPGDHRTMITGDGAAPSRVVLPTIGRTHGVIDRFF